MSVEFNHTITIYTTGDIYQLPPGLLSKRNVLPEVYTQCVPSVQFMCPSISLSLFLCVYVCVCAHVHVVMVPVKAQESYSVGVWTMRARESVREHRNAGAGCVSAPELKVDLFCTVHFAAVSNFLSRNSLCDVTVAL